MTLPNAIRGEVEAALGGGRLRRSTPVGGGCINETLTVGTDTDREGFLKWNPSAPQDFFQAEARGLELLEAWIEEGEFTRLRVPRVLGLGRTDAGGWLLLEQIPHGREGRPFWEGLGRELAALHAMEPPGESDIGPNFIGPLPQDNRPRDSWGEFWALNRIQPQLELAFDAGHFGRGQDQTWTRLLTRIPEIVPDLPPAERSLLHGDLWGGNVFPDDEGRAVLVDPAVELGDFRVDLAMTELFGGFDPGFYGAYAEVRDPGPEYGEILRDVYQLYPMLVHVNLFGGGYVSGTLERAHRILALLE